MELALSLLLGVGLASAAGLRIFIPALVASLGAQQGIISPGEGFEWLGTWPAVAAFGVATLVEIGGYYIPWVDNLLDTIAGPGAVIAGGLIATSFLEVDSEALRWVLGLIAGGGAAGLVQGGTTLLRATSTATTGGLANPVVSTGEAVGAVSLSVMSVLAPVIAVALLLVLGVLVWRRVRRRRRRTAQASPTTPPPNTPAPPR